MTNTSTLLAGRFLSVTLFAGILMSFLLYVPQVRAGCVQLQTYPPQYVCTADTGTAVPTSPGTVCTGVGSCTSVSTPTPTPTAVCTSVGCTSTSTSSGANTGDTAGTVCPTYPCVGVTTPGSPPTSTGSGPVARWMFDEADGTVAIDSSGNGNDGTLENGATRYVGSQEGSKLLLDGVDDRMRVDNPSQGIQNMSSFTIMAWIRPTENSGTIMRKGNTDNGRFNFGVKSDGRLYLRTGRTVRQGVWQTSSIIPLNEWSHVAVTYSFGSLSNRARFYVNGVEQGTLSSVVNPGLYDPADPIGDPYPDSPYLFVGHNHNLTENTSQPPGDPGFEGRMDEVRVYNFELSGEAINTARASVPPGPYLTIPIGVVVQSTDTVNTGAIASLKAQIEALLAQLELLQGTAQVGVQTGTLTGVQTGLQAWESATCPVLTRNLARGSVGDDVKQLQQYLIAQGFLAAGNDTGYFGALTEAAVKQWQSAHGIEPLGIVGPKTRAAITASCSGTPGGVTFSATPTSGNAPLAVAFKYSTGGSGGHTIDFGDGRVASFSQCAQTASYPSTTHCSIDYTYKAAGTYNAKLIYQGTVVSTAVISVRGGVSSSPCISLTPGVDCGSWGP